jgi:hypothetical protein
VESNKEVDHIHFFCDVAYLQWQIFQTSILNA